MTLLASRLAAVRPSATVSITAQAAHLRAQGRDIIALSAGEPDFDTPAHIREAAKQAIDAGHTRYTAPDGLSALKSAIADKFARENGITYSPDQIMVSSGGKQVLFNALLATLDPGDEVIVPAPYWVSYPDIVTLCGATPVIVPCPAAEGFVLRPQALARAITPATKWLILNSPGNPTGAGYGADDLRALAQVLRDHPQVHVLCDDIYEHITFDGFRFATMAQVAPDLAGRVLTLNGVSKSYAMTGWRIGYCGGPAPLVAAMRKVQGQSTTSACTISQHAAIAALTGPQDYIASAGAAFARRRDMVVAALNAAPGLSCPVPQGAFYVYPSVAGLIGRRGPAGQMIETDADFVAQLLDMTGVALVHGAAFGLSPHVRLSFAAADEVLRDACARILDFCAQCQ